DPLHDLIVRHHLKGVAVEPLPDMFSELQRTYARYPEVALENVAIHRSEKSLTLYRTIPTANIPDWAHGIASLDPTHHVKAGIPAEVVTTSTVEAITLDALLQRHNVQALDLFLVDTEGYDVEIVRMLLETDVRPNLICFE